MLNLKDISERIASPALINYNDLEDLRQLCTTYPFAQIFPILYLKGLAQTKDIRFEVELQRLAFSISDRTMLYSLVHEDAIAEQPIASIEKEVIQIETVVIPILEASYIETPTGSHSEENSLKSEAVEIPELIEEVVGLETEVTIIPEESIEVEEIEPFEEKPFFDEITALTIASSYSLEREELELTAKTSSQKEKVEEKIEIEETEIAENKPSSFEKPVEIEAKKSFSSWLHSDSNYVEIKEEKIEVDTLIAKFIEDSPKISQPNEKIFEGRKEPKEFFSPVKKAKESLDDTQLPVSETLAKIFAAQGNFPKAIYAYEQLMLIIPEKKIFFANQIKELQKKLNQ